MFRRVAAFTVIAFAAIVFALQPSAFAQSKNQSHGQPGQFDFYVLALSWSPTFCDAQRASHRAPGQQCGSRPYAFVVHGLWPQYEHGYPSYCQVPAPRLDHAAVSSALELMPSPHLVFHEWDRHGTCSGMTAQDYFESVRKARAAVQVPADYVALPAARTVSPDAIEDAFAKANPGLSRGAIAVVCDSKRLREVRVCLGKDFTFHDCPEVARATCKRDSIVMPPVRGARAADDTTLQSH